jgi:UDP-glucuronate decarboxylase
MNINEKNITGPINLGNENEFTVLNLAEEIINITNTNSNIVFKKLPSDDPRQRKPDISYAKKIINWKPRVELKEGLTETIKYFESIL